MKEQLHVIKNVDLKNMVEEEIQSLFMENKSRETKIIRVPIIRTPISASSGCSME